MLDEYTHLQYPGLDCWALSPACIGKEAEHSGKVRLPIYHGWYQQHKYFYIHMCLVTVIVIKQRLPLGRVVLIGYCIIEIKYIMPVRSVVANTIGI